MNDLIKKLTEAVKNDLTPSLGVTEPGAIAFAAASAARALGGRVESVTARLNSGVYKNSFTCAVPGTDGMGCALAAALGAVAGDPEKGLTATEGALSADISEAKRLVELGRAKAELASVSPDIYIEAEVMTENGSARAVVSGRHDRLTELWVNGEKLASGHASNDRHEESFSVSSRSFRELIECAENAPDPVFLEEAVEMNVGLYEEGVRSGLIPLTASRIKDASEAMNYAELLTCGAIEARVRGAKAPAMALTGSGSHGILAFLPIHAAARLLSISTERERRALLLSALVTMYIKENSGLLSTACGCVLAGGTGAALGLTYLRSKEKSLDRLEKMLTDTLNSMAASVTGMICHGGNTGCSLKAAVGVRMAFAASDMALAGFGAENVHGILGPTPEETMKNMGRVARDMASVENTILEIMSCKKSGMLL